MPATPPGPRLAAVIPLAASLLAAGAAGAAAAPADAVRWLSGQGYAAPSPTTIIACHGYGCVRRTTFAIEAPWLDRAASLLAAGRGSDDGERSAIARVIRLFTAEVASRIGGLRDLPRSPPAYSNVAGQMDCLDVTANITSLFVVLDRRGLLGRYHVEQPTSRGFFFDGRYPHYTAVLSGNDGKRWAFDPWARAPGQRPDVLPVPVWQARSQ